MNDIEKLLKDLLKDWRERRRMRRILDKEGAEAYLEETRRKR